ncbi:MAG: 23S rRNA (guanosine(2251)-2'-O)-methyltransferase RlmB [Bacteroidetes bacterium]|nr:MAG: 23S rRNA (guanosine(2251)-2'-O)-methyltransferase RlmB [Bacteroidota bacterium]
MKKDKTQLIYGRHPVIDAINEGTNFDKIFLQQGTRGEFEKELRKLCNKHNIPLTVAPKEKLNKFTRSNHQGVIGLVSLIPYYLIEDLLPSIYENNENPLILILDGVTDVRNFGAIARSAEICGAHALVVPRKGSALINAEALKTSAGALTKIPVCRENSLITAIETIQMSGIKVMASSLKAEKLLFNFDLTEPVALIVGAEGEGISTGVERKADELFIIPQAGTTDSFNVSVATGIMLYEVMRQRMV